MSTEIPAPAQTWEHKGVTITFDAKYACFRYAIAGKNKTSDSLNAARAAIDKATVAKAAEGLPFTAVEYRDNGYGGGKPTFVTRVVVGIDREHRGRDMEWQFEDEKGTERAVVEDTPENRSLLKTHHDLRAEARASERSYSERIEAARRLIPYRRAGEPK